VYFSGVYLYTTDPPTAAECDTDESIDQGRADWDREIQNVMRARRIATLRPRNPVCVFLCFIIPILGMIQTNY